MVAASATRVSALNDRVYTIGSMGRTWIAPASGTAARAALSNPNRPTIAISRPIAAPVTMVPCPPRQHRVENAAVRGAEGHANAQLLRSLLNGKRAFADGPVIARKTADMGEEQDESGHLPERSSANERGRLKGSARRLQTLKSLALRCGGWVSGDWRSRSIQTESHRSVRRRAKLTRSHCCHFLARSPLWLHPRCGRRGTRGLRRNRRRPEGLQFTPPPAGVAHALHHLHLETRRRAGGRRLGDVTV